MKRPLQLVGQKRVWLEGCEGGGPVDFGQDIDFAYRPIAFGASVGSLGGGDSVLLSWLKPHSDPGVRDPIGQGYSTKVVVFFL